MLASNGGREVDRHFELALRSATPQLRSLAVRYYVSPPGESPPGLPVVYRDRLSVVTRDPEALPFARIERPGRAAQAARVISREPDRIVIAPPGPGRLVVADLVYPGWKVQHRRSRRPRAGGGRSARGRRTRGRAPGHLDVHAAGRARSAP